MKKIYLPIKKKWFEMILRHQKLEEYRKINDYYARRLIVSSTCNPVGFEWATWREMIDDLNSPYHRFDGPDHVMSYYGVTFKHFDIVKFRNGYRPGSPVMEVRLKKIVVKQGSQAWGAEPGRFYFTFLLGDIIR